MTCNTCAAHKAARSSCRLMQRLRNSGFRTRADSQKFVKEISALYSKLGGFDGLDWNTFGAARSVDVGEISWISLELKRKYSGFIITASPAPWNEVDKKFCHAMVLSGAMDYAAPQYYGGSNLADPSYVINSVAEWSELLGQSHVVVGLGINNAANYMTGLRAMETWTKIEASFPSIRGSSNWDINTDERQGWIFAKSVGLTDQNQILTFKLGVRRHYTTLIAKLLSRVAGSCQGWPRNARWRLWQRCQAGRKACDHGTQLFA